ncbi:MAG: ATP-dependent helicase UvrD/PcrA [Gaiellaceae bacterium]|nr:ATP-dependent helicase UvrD/PcrA [Gaiellaceae bacterium]
MDSEGIFEGLNDQQRRAVEAVRGPVCILAGAGSGKTTTITRRIANQVATGTFRPDQILAVTFTDKAAGEMRARLGRLGVSGVAARTFHSAALAQLHHFAPGRVGQILASKALLLRQIGNTLPAPYKFRPAGDLATEIEWAKNRRLTPETYQRELGDHQPPIPADLAYCVFYEYEKRKEGSGAVDFEDLLELTIRLYDEDEAALMTFRDRYRAFTVDEYQDVNLLQQTLLERWLGGSDELCAVGDDYQSIYGFTGASPQHLLGLPERFPHAHVIRLEQNYRSTPQILELANRLVPRLGGSEKVLRATRPSGPAPELAQCIDPEAQCAALVARARALRAEGLAYEEMAILFRLNSRSAELESALAEADIPFQGASLLARDAARGLVKVLRRRGVEPAATAVRAAAAQQGWVEQPQTGLGEREQTRQNDLAFLVRLAEAFEQGEADVLAFLAMLEARFGSHGNERRGIHLLTYHRAKGLEFDAVFLPRLEDKELPARQAKTPAQLAEERRLLYVGLTRARKHLLVTWAGKPSPFLAELGIEPPPPRRAPEPDDPVYAALKAWRLERSKSDDVPAYVVFHNSTLEEIATRGPSSLAELASVPGVGPTKIERYGPDVLAVLSAR